MQQVPEVSPFTFVFQSIAHEQHAKQNEDTVLLDPRHGLAAIFDGMGSRRGADALGQIASQLAARVVHRSWERLLQQGQPENSGMLPCGRLDLSAALRQLIQEANTQIRAEGLRQADAERPPQLRVRYPKTTGVLVVFCHHKDEDGYTMVSAHVGDSRIYLLREHASLVRLTQDDGFLTTLIQSQTISETDALRWPEPEQAIEHQQVDGGIHTANQSETHELPDGPASCFSFGGGMHMCLVRFARQRCGRW